MQVSVKRVLFIFLALLFCIALAGCAVYDRDIPSLTVSASKRATPVGFSSGSWRSGSYSFIADPPDFSNEKTRGKLPLINSNDGIVKLSFSRKPDQLSAEIAFQAGSTTFKQLQIEDGSTISVPGGEWYCHVGANWEEKNGTGGYASYWFRIESSAPALPEEERGITVKCGDNTIQVPKTDRNPLIDVKNLTIPFILCAPGENISFEFPYKPDTITYSGCPSGVLGWGSPEEVYSSFRRFDPIDNTFPAGDIEYIHKLDISWHAEDGTEKNATYAFLSGPSAPHKRFMTLEDVKDIAANSNTVTLQSLEDEFYCANGYSGRLVLTCIVDDIFEFSAGEPVDLKLRLAEPRIPWIDLTPDADIDAFVKQCKDIMALKEPDKTIALMRIKYPQFFGLDTSDGLTVIVDSIAEGKYGAYFASGKINSISPELAKKRTTAGPLEAKAILQDYSEVPVEKVYIRPFYDSRMEYQISYEEFAARLNELFGSQYKIGPEIK